MMNDRFTRGLIQSRAGGVESLAGFVIGLGFHNCRDSCADQTLISAVANSRNSGGLETFLTGFMMWQSNYSFQIANILSRQL